MDTNLTAEQAELRRLSRIHASDESVDPEEIERLIRTQVLFIQHLAAAHGNAGPAER